MSSAVFDLDTLREAFFDARLSVGVSLVWILDLWWLSMAESMEVETVRALLVLRFDFKESKMDNAAAVSMTSLLLLNSLTRLSCRLFLSCCLLRRFLTASDVTVPSDRVRTDLTDVIALTSSSPP
jgi:hypothetical protein